MKARMGIGIFFINIKHIAASKGMEGTPFEKVFKQFNQFVGTPLTRDESLKILNFEEELPKEKIDPKEVMTVSLYILS